MSRYDALADLDAEKALLGACLLSVAAVIDTSAYVTPGDFISDRHQLIYAELLEQSKTGRSDAVTIASRLGGEGTLGYLHNLQNNTPSISNARQYAELIADFRLRRNLVHASEAIANLAFNSPTAADAADQSRALLDPLDTPLIGADPDPTLDEFIDATPSEYEWLIPDFLERRDRMLVTASEGSGKSILIAQIGVMAAAGVHPWTHEPIPPCNVTIIDLENGPRLLARRLTWLRSKLPTIEPGRVRVHADPRGLNLTARTDRRWLMERCFANSTDLLIIGPAYRMTAGVQSRGDIGGEDHTRQVTKALDDIRNACDVTLILEPHAPHSKDGFGRDLRPFGSSVWLRWPEFGIGLRRDDPDGDGTPRKYRLEHWRGPRDQRTWPTHLLRGEGKMPWTPSGMPAGTFTNRGAA